MYPSKFAQIYIHNIGRGFTSLVVIIHRKKTLLLPEGNLMLDNCNFLQFILYNFLERGLDSDCCGQGMILCITVCITVVMTKTLSRKALFISL